ncbi:hypothetical protein OUZ56_005875 [Daphnia magna]|uniref:Uncharacterized protein n=1 Tax=Daphnia magna TaxID=35525 RepID=A0ABQ9YU05_9CRUS|nr:hypothetical protein OUZ56_005875 [Daphnia magna]
MHTMPWEDDRGLHSLLCEVASHGYQTLQVSTGNHGQITNLFMCGLGGRLCINFLNVLGEKSKPST